MDMTIHMSNDTLQTLLMTNKRFRLRKPVKTIERMKKFKFTEAISLKDFSYVRKMAKKHKILIRVTKTVNSAKGLAELGKITGNEMYALDLERKIYRDKAVENYLLKDLERIALMPEEAKINMRDRLEIVIKQIEAIDMNPDDKLDEILKIQNSPETYFKFARSAECLQVGFAPNYFSDALEKAGYSKEELTKLMSLIHLPACCTTDEEWKMLVQSREQIPDAIHGYRIIPADEVRNHMGYHKDRNYSGVAGFWADMRLYKDPATRSELIYGLLRVDFDGSKHRAQNKEKTYLVHFMAEGIGDKSKIPFQREIQAIDGNLSNNLPYNPFTGNGYTSTRNHMIVPENKIEVDNAVPFTSEEMIIGYLDKKGDFNGMFVYYDNQWRTVENYSVLKRAELMTELEDVFQELPSRQNVMVDQDFVKKDNGNLGMERD